MNNEAENFGRGLRELGLKAKENVVLFAETRAEWLITANGCMKQNMPLVTLYATLGDEALVHGINETEVNCVITTQELLPKFKNILPLTPNVSVLVNLFSYFIAITYNVCLFFNRLDCYRRRIEAAGFKRLWGVSQSTFLQ